MLCQHGYPTAQGRDLPWQAGSFEVRRILKAFVDARWLAEFDTRLAAYREQLAHETPEAPELSDE